MDRHSADFKILKKNFCEYLEKEGHGMEPDDLVVTNDDLAAFEKYNGKGTPFEVAGFKGLKICLRRGKTDIYILDAGEDRLAYEG